VENTTKRVVTLRKQANKHSRIADVNNWG